MEPEKKRLSLYYYSMKVARKDLFFILWYAVPISRVSSIVVILFLITLFNI